MDLMAGITTELRDENAEGNCSILSVITSFTVFLTCTRRLEQPRPRRTSFSE